MNYVETEFELRPFFLQLKKVRRRNRSLNEKIEDSGQGRQILTSASFSILSTASFSAKCLRPLKFDKFWLQTESRDYIRLQIIVRDCNRFHGRRFVIYVRKSEWNGRARRDCNRWSLAFDRSRVPCNLTCKSLWKFIKRRYLYDRAQLHINSWLHVKSTNHDPCQLCKDFRGVILRISCFLEATRALNEKWVRVQEYWRCLGIVLFWLV